MNRVRFVRYGNTIRVPVHSRLAHASAIKAGTEVSARVNGGSLIFSRKPKPIDQPVEAIPFNDGVYLCLPMRLVHACFIGTKDTEVDLFLNNYGELVLRRVKIDPIKQSMRDLVRGKITPEMAVMLGANKKKLH